MQRLLRHHIALRALWLAIGAEQPLFNLDLQLCFNLLRIRSRSDASGYVEPVLFAKLHEVRRAIDGHFGVERKPEGWDALHTVAIESRRRNADYRKRLAIEGEAAAHDRLILPELLLPRRIADHSDGFGAFVVIIRPEHTSRVGANSEHREIISRNVLNAQ